MKRFGLIGYPLGHSFSKGYFIEKFIREDRPDSVYENFPLDSAGGLPELIASHPDLQGLNVTIPHKQAVLSCLDELDQQAAQIGAVNCIKITRSGGKIHLKGYNTDAWGFGRSLAEMLGKERPDALVLGTGGASKAVAYVLKQLGIRFRFVSRTGDGEAILSYEGLTPETIARTRLIVNTTPLGTYPDTGAMPAIPYDGIGRGHFLHDLVYNPSETAFLREGRVREAAVKNGYAMLVGQAERSWEIWNGTE